MKRHTPHLHAIVATRRDFDDVAPHTTPELVCRALEVTLWVWRRPARSRSSESLAGSRLGGHSAENAGGSRNAVIPVFGPVHPDILPIDEGHHRGGAPVSGMAPADRRLGRRSEVEAARHNGAGSAATRLRGSGSQTPYFGTTRAPGNDGAQRSAGTRRPPGIWRFCAGVGFSPGAKGHASRPEDSAPARERRAPCPVKSERGSCCRRLSLGPRRGGPQPR